MYLVISDSGWLSLEHFLLVWSVEPPNPESITLQNRIRIGLIKGPRKQNMLKGVLRETENITVLMTYQRAS